MAIERGTRRIDIDPSTWNWLLPAEARHRLDGLARLAGTDPLGSGKPLPAKYHLEILGELLDHLFPEGTAEHLIETGASLHSPLQDYLAHLIHRARLELDKRQAAEPSIRLGFPPGTRETWANLIGAAWVPWQPGWFGVLRD